ncbi:MAG TPA: hypothetical protein VIG44_09955, partial [Thermomicrobiales bacterium]
GAIFVDIPLKLLGVHVAPLQDTGALLNGFQGTLRIVAGPDVLGPTHDIVADAIRLKDNGLGVLLIQSAGKFIIGVEFDCMSLYRAFLSCHGLIISHYTKGSVTGEGL